MSQREGRTQFIILFPDFLRQTMEELAERNYRDFTGELCVATERYITGGITDPPPQYEGTLRRRKLWLPEEIHKAVSVLAVQRGWSMNQVFMAAANWHVEQEY